ncbi:MAG: glycosyltransferase [Bulleidia sp.]|nr:glycosyltransferase [Bulleidia sp.]
MRIAFVNSVAGYGSTGQIVYSLSRLPGVQGRIYYGRKENLTDADVYRITDFKGNAVHAMDTFLMDNQGFANKHETEKMVENLKAFDPDLIHLHNLHGYYLNTEVLFNYLKESGKPVVWTFHDCWPFTGHCAHYDSFHCEQWKTECRKCPAIHTYPVSFNGLRVNKNFNRKKELFTSLGRQLTIVTPSFWLESQVKESFLSETRVRTIHNGIDHTVFHPVRTNFRKNNHLEDKFIILAAASIWTESKGLNQLAEMSKYLEGNMVMIVVGLKSGQRKLFSEQTICLERTENQKELVDLYSNADVFVNPTLDETLSLVNIEANACGCPVVTFNTGGAPETISEKSGIVVERGNVDEAMHAVQRIYNNEISFNRKDCEKNSMQFDVRQMKAAYGQLYQERTGLLL